MSTATGSSWPARTSSATGSSCSASGRTTASTGRSVELGAGLTHGFSDKLDFVASLSYVDAEVKAGNFTADDDGLALGGGIRSRVADSVELDAGLKYVDFDNAGGDTGVSVGGRYYFNDSMALGASADFNDNADTLHIGFRWEF